MSRDSPREINIHLGHLSRKLKQERSGALESNFLIGFKSEGLRGAENKNSYVFCGVLAAESYMANIGACLYECSCYAHTCALTCTVAACQDNLGKGSCL